MDKITVRRANVVLDIKPEDKEFYMSQGYSVIDDTGKVVEEAMSVNANELQVQVTELKKQLADAEKTIAKLTSELNNRNTKENKERKPRSGKE